MIWAKIWLESVLAADPMREWERLPSRGRRTLLICDASRRM